MYVDLKFLAEKICKNKKWMMMQQLMLPPLLILSFLFLWNTPVTYASSNEEKNEGLRRPISQSGLPVKDSSMHVVADRGNKRQLQLGGPCQKWCLMNSKPWAQKCAWVINCAGCDQCTMPQVAIREVTADLNPPSNIWDGDDMAHSFGIGLNHFPPTFTDWDGDGFLDFFFNNHYKADYAADFDLGVSRTKIENSVSSTLQIEFQSIGFETFVDGDSEEMFHDCHGSIFADMDGDGILDLLISVGGGRGESVGKRNDNLLFWGEETSDGDVRLVGGREAAVAAGVQCSNCRGRYVLVTDADQDGRLDVFPISDKRVDDIQTPTPLLLNNGDRTFTDQPSFNEFTRTILLTDADGDGFAQEYMVFRATCFRDPSKFDHSIWPHNEFCEERPEKTTAIYKYDDQVGKMVLISPEYTRTLENQNYTPWNNEAAVDAVSGDFDFDLKADQIVLFWNKMVFYYSSDRSDGELPLYNEDLNQLGSTEMTVPCSWRAAALRVVDLDMDGRMELVLLCSDLGEIYLYSQTERPKEWNLDTSWNLGDLTRTTGWGPTPTQVALACNRGVKRNGYPNYFDNICKNPNYIQKFYGFQVVDLNNDGYLDFVVSSSIGKHRFFANEPVTVAQNRFLVFELKSTVSNDYAIGATLIFTASGLNPQLREISSFGYGNARSGGRDDRLVFGLGATAMPQSLTVRWPSTAEKVYDLSSLDASHFSDYSMPVVIMEP